MQLKAPFLVIVTFAFSINLFSQQQINIATGLAIDVNNNKPIGGNILNIPVVLQYLPVTSRFGSFIINANIQLPNWNKYGYDSAFSLTTTPNAIRLNKFIQYFGFAINFGYRFIIPRTVEQHFFIDFLPLGICHQQFTVKYKNYNSSQYDILNPDMNKDNTGFVAGLGFGYGYKNFLSEVLIQTPLLDFTTPKYSLSYKYAAPLQLTIGYSFKFKKQKK